VKKILISALMTATLCAGCEDAERAAFYILQPDDYPHLESGDTRYAFAEQTGMVVCNAALDPERVREHFPHALVLAAFSSHSKPIWGANNAFWNEFRLELESVPVFPVGDWPNTLELRLSRSGGMYLADAILDVVDFGKGGYDGLYLDECWAFLPPRIRDLTGQTQRDWEAHAEGFFAQWEMRKGPPILGNVGSMKNGADERILAYPLRGVSVEAAHVKPPHNEPLELMTAENLFTEHDAAWCVAWGWEPLKARARYGIHRRATNIPEPTPGAIVE
jgi:hypothetical protein